MKLLRSYPRLIAFAILAGVTAYGLWTFFSGDWQSALGHWKSRWPTLCVVLGIRSIDAVVDALLWMWVLRLFDIRLNWTRGSLVFLTGYAGLLLPMQLGRLVRSDAVARLGFGPLGETVKAEAIWLFLTLIAAVTVLSSVLMYLVAPIAVPLLVVGVTGFFLLGANYLFKFLSKTKISVAPGFWLRPQIFLITLLATLGWILQGTALWVVMREVLGEVQLWEAWLVGPANLLVGTGTGLPGGIGVVEGGLGISLSMLGVADTDVPLAVGAFRLITFWLWIPVGWLALLQVNRWAARRQQMEMQNEK